MHDSCRLVTQNSGKLTLWVLACLRVNIGMAKSVRQDLDSNLASFG
eukprot:CAMPEP_0185592290 /NCGR_PEP_ID=MMETSP0434-20130131/67426_1 /TAXON_ID=626734 ORGANISM="Favella taraikaensis, Strain Fe Narragansett Bay" /NCGR_SAMPLE_ID=MMETSP0434 /ASSEMBLY_ACC=CAM_ASM_000379 /LENGTH=45 /DNA_ID= /DNA_START= /DNA_END= /DNA_ORIENTATION=